MLLRTTSSKKSIYYNNSPLRKQRAICRNILISFFLINSTLPYSPERRRDAVRAVDAGEEADNERERKAQDGLNACDKRDDADSRHCDDRGGGGVYRAAEGLADAHVNKLTEGLAVTVEAAVFTDTVVDDDGRVDGVAEDGEKYGHEVRVNIESANEAAGIDKAHIVHERDDCAAACDPSAYSAESETDVDYHDDGREDDGHDALAEESETGRGVNVLRAEYLEVIAGKLLLKSVSEVVLSVGSQTLGSREAEGDGGGAACKAFAEGDIALLTRYRLRGLCHSAFTDGAVIGVGDDGAALELDGDVHAENRGEDKAKDYNRERHDIEYLFLSHYIKGLILH